MIGDTIHWYFHDKCNLDCLVCFKPNQDFEASTERLETLTRVLIDNNVKKVVLTGGEPMLEKHLLSILRMLKTAGIYTSLHTNGTLLNDKVITELSDFVDDIAIPIDSTNRLTQTRLRSKTFLKVLDNIREISDAIKENHIKLGFHTVYTMANKNDMPDIYKTIVQTGFDYWRIYEFNDYLCYTSLAEKKLCSTKAEQIEYIKMLQAIQELQPANLILDESRNKLLEYFVRTSQKMPKDKRIQFVPVNEFKIPYLFLNNSGELLIHDFMAGGTRFPLGNILQEEMGPLVDISKKHIKWLEEIVPRIGYRNIPKKT